MILLVPDAPASVVTGLSEFFEIAGLDMNERRAKRPCRVRTASVQADRVPLRGKVIIEPDIVGRMTEPCDLVIVPALGPNVAGIRRRLGMEIEWLKDAASRGTRIASVCSGAFLLASTGLIDDREATTHWLFAPLFRRMFPRVKLNVDRLVIDTGKFLTSGGSNAFYDLALHVIEQSLGRDTALSCARHFLLDTNRVSQTPFIAFSAQKHHGDAGIGAAQTILEKEFSTALSIDTIADRVGMSPRNFKRKFKQVTGDAPSVYLQRLRIEWARNRLAETGDSIESISYAVGYENVGFFRLLFKRHTGLTPFDYRKKNSRASRN